MFQQWAEREGVLARPGCFDPIPAWCCNAQALVARVAHGLKTWLCTSPRVATGT